MLIAALLPPPRGNKPHIAEPSHGPNAHLDPGFLIVVQQLPALPGSIEVGIAECFKRFDVGGVFGASKPGGASSAHPVTRIATDATLHRMRTSLA